MVTYIIFPDLGDGSGVIGIAVWHGVHIGRGELWAYTHGGAHRHESVWIVPGLAQ
jgi:hypothetical protein